MTRSLGLALALVAATPALLPAQYFGQNKVQYRTFDFEVIQTEHFDVYFYEREREAALDAARMAERAYARLSRALNHRFRERKPIIVYASHSDFQQTNATSGEVGEGTGGFTDFLKHRNVLPFTGSYAEFEHVLQHEMVHQFQYDVWSRGRAGANIQALIALNPPLWFVEGMAEYFSKGRVDANTAMWLRDAALEGTLPTIDQMTNDPRIFPYRFGEGLIAYIGERWGDEAVAAILHGTLGGNLEGSFRRVIGIGFEELSNQWRDYVQKKYLPQIGNRVRASSFARAVLTEENSDGTLHLAPALSPDGTKIAYFSEKDFYFVDLYLADAVTGAVDRRLLKSSFSANYETFRFINSGVSWSPDGRYIAMAAKKGPKDDLVILDVARNKEIRRIEVDLNGILTPEWSPDGSQLVFTGLDGGLSNLYVINVDGSGFRALTRDREADMHPVWSPDGATIAFATDRGPETSFDSLTFSNLRIALYHVATGRIEVLDHMAEGLNANPQFSPDGRQIAFTSDRNGVTNIYLYDLAGRRLLQLTDLFTGVQGITPLSPALSWAKKADRLAFVYYEDSEHDVYTLDNPRSLARPYLPRPVDAGIDVAVTPPPVVQRDTAPEAGGAIQQGGSIYRGQAGFRESGVARRDTLAPAPVSISALLDSATINLPDTSEFAIRKARTKFTADYVARPSVGYSRDTFGRGFFGGTAIALSDMLGDHTLIFSGYVNGSLAESQILAAYINQRRRLNWAVGAGQEPYFYREAQVIRRDPAPSPTVSRDTLITNVRRLVLRTVFTEAYYPLNRFRRIETGLRFANVSDDRLSLVEPFNGRTGTATDKAFIRTTDLGSSNYVQPSLAMVFDNSLFGYVGPFYGRRYRLQVAQSVGTWNFTTATVDYRRYDQLPGPFVLATRGLYFGRIGEDAREFQIFLGSSDLLRGHTSGSYFRNECDATNDSGSLSGCRQLDRLIGTQIAVANAELRFPVANSQMFQWLPLGFPPLEGALFYDIGLAWNEESVVRLNGDDNGNPLRFRTPLHSYGASLRTNLFNFVILRLDYSVPIGREGFSGGLWTLSLGPTF